MDRISFNEGWCFRAAGGTWTRITLPHDAQLLDPRRADSPGGAGHGYFVGNIYEYEKRFVAPADWEDKHIEVLFEGIYRNAVVSLNGVKIAEHRYGYTEFTVCLDDHLLYGQENVLTVVADNSKLPNSRWYSGGGIYRPVSLLTGARAHINYLGVRISTLQVNPAIIHVTTDASEGEISVEIIKDNVIVATASGAECDIAIENAQLWSDETPELYKAHVVLTRGGVIQDETCESFGIRQIECSVQGLFVNGRNTLLRGGCVHHDNGILGAASLRESEFRKVRILKEQGFNAIRSAHNPASTALLEACDHYGMYVMDETFDMWYVRKTRYDYGCDFNDCWKEDVRAMVARDYNHPSVLMYSIGNEVSEPGKPDGVGQGKAIIGLIKSLDSSRIVTGGMNLMIMTNYAKGKGLYDHADQEEKAAAKAGGQEAKNGSLLFNTIASFIGSGMNKAGNSDKADRITSPILDALDVAGYNYASGRYPLEATHHPDRVVVGSETFPYEIGKNWDMVRKYPYLIGDFMWTAWDYLGEAGLGAWSYTGGVPFNRPYPWLLGGAGVIDILGNPDASCGFARVVWGATDRPVIGVRPVNHPGVRVSKSIWRGTNAITSWSWKGCDGNKALIDVFARADHVELLINGRSIGKKKIKCYQTLFKTKYQAGTIEAIAYDASGAEISREKLTSASDAKVVIRPETDICRPGDIMYIDINIEDEQGIVECNSDRKLSVTVEGGELLAFGSANPCTEEAYLSGSFTTYYGRALAVVRAQDADRLLIHVMDGSNQVQKSIKIIK